MIHTISDYTLDATILLTLNRTAPAPHVYRSILIAIDVSAAVRYKDEGHRHSGIIC